MIQRALALAALALALAVPARAAGPSIDAREQRLESQIMCPTCHQLLALSHSPIAERMRGFVRARLAAGERPAAIERELVGEFGPAVLAAPPARGFGLFAWLVPAGGLALTATVVLTFACAWRRRTLLADAAAADVPRELLRRLERELAAFDD